MSIRYKPTSITCNLITLSPIFKVTVDHVLVRVIKRKLYIYIYISCGLNHEVEDKIHMQMNIWFQTA